MTSRMNEVAHTRYRGPHDASQTDHNWGTAIVRATRLTAVMSTREQDTLPERRALLHGGSRVSLLQSTGAIGGGVRIRKRRTFGKSGVTSSALLPDNVRPTTVVWKVICTLRIVVFFDTRGET